MNRRSFLAWTGLASLVPSKLFSQQSMEEEEGTCQGTPYHKLTDEEMARLLFEKGGHITQLLNRSDATKYILFRISGRRGMHIDAAKQLIVITDDSPTLLAYYPGLGFIWATSAYSPLYRYTEELRNGVIIKGYAQPDHQVTIDVGKNDIAFVSPTYIWGFRNFGDPSKQLIATRYESQWQRQNNKWDCVDTQVYQKMH